MRFVYNLHYSICRLTYLMHAYRIQAVDNVLKEHGVSDQDMYNRARGLLLLGAIFKSTVPDESDEERRELERCVLLLCAL